ncbi:hypothetical protein CANMA_003135 [Candida margitis]|uniref:uncharacterized protein n=1 Tax=Candida margitis TaxID=1775924 RepID=UPI002226C948|nr:uncharacterized protein CANMA_003135 [Candida margitis]KAI5967315.1 hypothetical protein CANMA_003135 [Candida margitis]
MDSDYHVSQDADEQFYPSSPPIPIKSKSTSNLHALIDKPSFPFHDSDVISSATTPIHPAHHSHYDSNNLTELNQEEINIPQSLHSIPPLPRQESYIPIGQVILRYLERWILGLIERHRDGPYFYPIAVAITIAVIVLIVILVFTGNFNALVRILRHLICELIQSVRPSSTLQFCN